MTYQSVENNVYERSRVTHEFCYCDDAYSQQELETIQLYCNSLSKKQGEINGDTEAYDSFRISDISFFDRNNETNWFFVKTNSIITHLNNLYYGFNLNGYSSFQYTEYTDKDKGRYNYHMDMDFGFSPNPQRISYSTRKLSFILFMSNKDEYEGGELKLMMSESDERVIEQKRGRIVVFPSFMLHKITPVTKGIRKSIVTWVEGPKFV